MATYKKGERAPMPRCPHPKHIGAIQFQLFDNGPKPGRGKSQHVMKIEVYCDGRLDLAKPTWWRACSLIEPKKFMTWVHRERATGNIDDAEFAQYDVMNKAMEGLAGDDEIEFAKLGHIGASEGGTTYYVGQFISVVKFAGKGLHVVMCNAGEQFECDRFFYNKAWKPTGRSRKFVGMYDPGGMYEAAKREKDAIAAVTARRAAQEAGE